MFTSLQGATRVLIYGTVSVDMLVFSMRVGGLATSKNRIMVLNISPSVVVVVKAYTVALTVGALRSGAVFNMAPKNVHFGFNVLHTCSTA